MTCKIGNPKSCYIFLSSQTTKYQVTFNSLLKLNSSKHACIISIIIIMFCVCENSCCNLYGSPADSSGSGIKIMYCTDWSRQLNRERTLPGSCHHRCQCGTVPQGKWNRWRLRRSWQSIAQEICNQGTRREGRKRAHSWSKQV